MSLSCTVIWALKGATGKKIKLWQTNSHYATIDDCCAVLLIILASGFFPLFRNEGCLTQVVSHKKSVTMSSDGLPHTNSNVWYIWYSGNKGNKIQQGCRVTVRVSCQWKHQQNVGTHQFGHHTVLQRPVERHYCSHDK